MKALNRAIHEVADTIGDAAKKDDTLNGIYAAEAAAASSKRGKLEGDAAKRVDEFRRDGHKLLGMLVDLEGMVLDGKTDAAKAKLKEIEEFRDASHKKFGVKDEGKEGGGGGGGGAPRGQRPPTGG